MSIFYCFRCDNLADADDGCIEHENHLICADCMTDVDEESQGEDSGKKQVKG